MDTRLLTTKKPKTENASNFPGIEDVGALMQQDGTERLLDCQQLPQLLRASLGPSRTPKYQHPEQRGSSLRLRNPLIDWDVLIKPKAQVTATSMRYKWCWASPNKTIRSLESNPIHRESKSITHVMHSVYFHVWELFISLGGFFTCFSLQHLRLV